MQLFCFQLEHEAVRRGGLSVSSIDSDSGLEYENRQLKDQITTLTCEVAHWKEVLKSQVIDTVAYRVLHTPVCM